MARKLKNNVVKRKYRVWWKLKEGFIGAEDEEVYCTTVKAESKEAARMTAPMWCEVLSVAEERPA